MQKYIQIQDLGEECSQQKTKQKMEREERSHVIFNTFFIFERPVLLMSFR